MMAASFAPMILKLVFPKLEKKMDELKLDIIEHIFKVGKIIESIEYREQPNELDDQVADMRIELKALKQHIIELDKDSHPKKPFDERITALEKKLAK